MAIRYYDDAIVQKLKSWIPDNGVLRVLKPDETKRLFETLADDTNDKPVKLPLITLTRDKDIEVLRTTKSWRSFDGIRMITDNAEYDDAVSNVTGTIADKTAVLNVIPIRVNYKIDIYTKEFEEGDEYVRNFVFKLVNNPTFTIEIPYQNLDYQHTANLRVMSTISDTSDISEHLFPGQFTRWTIGLELQDGFLFNIPYRNNWRLLGAEVALNTKIDTSITTGIDMEIEDVTQTVLPTALAFIEDNVTMQKGSSQQLYVKFTPNDAAEDPTGGLLIWRSSNERILMVSSTGYAHALKPGQVTVTAKSMFNKDLIIACTVTVTA